MNVIDLIDKLKRFDPLLPLFIQGYEGGIDDVMDAKKIDVLLDVNEEAYLGRHEQASDKAGQPAIVLISNRRQ